MFSVADNVKDLYFALGLNSEQQGTDSEQEQSASEAAESRQEGKKGGSVLDTKQDMRTKLKKFLLGREEGSHERFMAGKRRRRRHTISNQGIKSVISGAESGEIGVNERLRQLADQVQLAKVHGQDLDLEILSPDGKMGGRKKYQIGDQTSKKGRRKVRTRSALIFKSKVEEGLDTGPEDRNLGRGKTQIGNYPSLEQVIQLKNQQSKPPVVIEEDMDFSSESGVITRMMQLKRAPKEAGTSFVFGPNAISQDPSDNRSKGDVGDRSCTGQEGQDIYEDGIYSNSSESEENNSNKENYAKKITFNPYTIQVYKDQDQDRDHFVEVFSDQKLELSYDEENQNNHFLYEDPLPESERQLVISKAEGHELEDNSFKYNGGGKNNDKKNFKNLKNFEISEKNQNYFLSPPLPIQYSPSINTNKSIMSRNTQKQQLRIQLDHQEDLSESRIKRPLHDFQLENLDVKQKYLPKGKPINLSLSFPSYFMFENLRIFLFNLLNSI